MNSPLQENACADICADVNEDEVFFRLCGAAIPLPLCCQVHVVFHNNQTVGNLTEHGAQGH